MIECQELTAYGGPLSAGRRAGAEPAGREVLVRVRHCGVCHSDLHIQDGYFDLGGEKQLDIGAGRPMPFTLGHEVEGEVVAMGPEAEGVSVGDRAVVYPWIGCGECPVCESGEEQLCARPRNIGVNLHGGYADRCMVPDAKYLFDYGDVAPALAATYACSGITAFGALKKLAPPGDGESIMIVGLGGVGMAGLAFARALFPGAPLVADIDAAKRQAALDAGAQAAFDSADPAAAKAVRRATGGGVSGAVDFVGSEASFGFADAVVRKGGRIVVVGLMGGRMSMPLPLFPLRALTVSGSLVGSPGDFAEMMALARAGKIAPTPVRVRPLAEANRVLDSLRAGEVVGRAVLAPG